MQRPLPPNSSFARSCAFRRIDEKRLLHTTSFLFLFILKHLPQLVAFLRANYQIARSQFHLTAFSDAVYRRTFLELMFERLVRPQRSWPLPRKHLLNIFIDLNQLRRSLRFPFALFRCHNLPCKGERYFNNRFARLASRRSASLIFFSYFATAFSNFVGSFRCRIVFTLGLMVRAYRSS